MLAIKFLPVWVLNPIRILGWLGLSAALFLWGIYIQMWRFGIIKYACMQEFTPEMNQHLYFVYHPLVAVESQIAIWLSGFVLAILILELRFGAQAVPQGISILKWFWKHPLWTFLFAGAGLYFYGPPNCFLHPGLFVLSAIAPLSTLFAPGRRS